MPMLLFSRVKRPPVELTEPAMLPVPVRVAPVPMVTAVFASEPVTSSVPFEMSVGPV